MGGELGDCCDVPAHGHAMEHKHERPDWVELPEFGMAL